MTAEDADGKVLAFAETEFICMVCVYVWPMPDRFRIGFQADQSQEASLLDIM